MSDHKAALECAKRLERWPAQDAGNLAAAYLELTAQLEAERKENMCDACAGTGKPASNLPCMCGGSGKMSDAARHMRELLFDERKAREELHEETMAIASTGQADFKRANAAFLATNLLGSKKHRAYLLWYSFDL